MSRKPTLDELRFFLANDFPQCTAIVESAGHGRARLRQTVGEAQLRPGHTVAGPVMMAVADAATYAAILSEIGIVPLAVTTNLSITFMRRPEAARDILGEATVLKIGQRLAVVEVRITSDGSDDLVAHATVTYSIPPRAESAQKKV